MLAQLFSEVVHLAPVHPEPPPASSMPYSSPNVMVQAVPPAGGKTILAKLGILTKMPEYWNKIRKELKQVDAVHVRCPANISMLAAVWLAFVQKPKPRWIKYAGNWQPDGRDPSSYAFQRWWLKKGFSKGVVTVNGRWPNQPTHVKSFYNPSLTDKDIVEGTNVAKTKKLQEPINLLFVGRVEEEKGASRAIKICWQLHKKDIQCYLHIIGDGPQSNQIQSYAKELGIESLVCFHGWMPRQEIADYYGKADFLLLPTAASEGWPKALSEGMAYGVVPIVGAVSSIPQFLAEFGTGVAIPPFNIEQFVAAIQDYLQKPAQWKQQSQNGLKVAEYFTFSHHLQAVRTLFESLD